jgi:thymidylate kinase
MLIVLEGCDGTGKTTLANNIAKVTGADIIHCTSTTQNDWNFFDTIIGLAKTHDIIADRFMYGQFVYQQAWEREKKGWLTDRDFVNLELKMMASNAKVFHVMAPINEIRRRLEARGELVPNLSSILTGFASVFEKSLLPIRVIDTTKEIW